MKLVRTFRGLEADLRPTGGIRWGSAGFLMLWLAFWTVGEGLALWILIQGGWSLLTGNPPGEGRAPLELAPSLAGGTFLLFWTTFWTFGGVIAWGELLRILFGRDRLVAAPHGLEVTQGYGLFRFKTDYARTAMRRFYVMPNKGSLNLVTAHGIVQLTNLGGLADRQELARTLNAEYRLAEEPSEAAILPSSWCERSGAGGPALIKNPVTRRRQAWVLGAISAFLVVVAAALVMSALAKPSYGALAAIFAALAGFAVWGTWRLAFTHEAWALSPGRITLQRHTPAGYSTRFEAAALELREEADSDGDPSFQLIALAVNATALPANHPNARSDRRTVLRVVSDPTEPRSLGLWLALRCGIPLTDYTTPEAKAADLEKLRDHLLASGRFGRWAARMIDRMGPRRG